MMIEKTLTLSTAHQPSAEPDFGDLRCADHEYGAVLFVAEGADVPEWLQPIHTCAVATGCTLILFDRDAPVEEAFTTYDW